MQLVFAKAEQKGQFMKKKIGVLMTVIACLVFSMLPTQAAISKEQKQENKMYIYEFLTAQMGLNSAAACGVLGNMRQECSFDPAAVSKTGSYHGLCQWGGARWTKLQQFCSKYGYSATSLDGQLFYLQWELTGKDPKGKSVTYKNNTFSQASVKGLYDACYQNLLKVTDSSDGSYEGSKIFCRDFEKPSNLETEYKRRGAFAKEFYAEINGNRSNVITDNAQVVHGVA